MKLEKVVTDIDKDSDDICENADACFVTITFNLDELGDIVGVLKRAVCLGREFDNSDFSDIAFRVELTQQLSNMRDTGLRKQQEDRRFHQFNQRKLKEAEDKDKER